MASDENSAAAKLVGLDIGNGWKIVQPIAKKQNATGGYFSHSYEAEKGGRKGFLKAFDFSQAFDPSVDTIEVLQALTASYHHERDVLFHCKDRRLSKVVVAIEHGNVRVPGFSQAESLVYYLIFELADGDIRGQIDSPKRFDTLWCLRALKDVCLGLHQVHGEMIAHQDLKPSNVLVYKAAGDFRLADFGRSSRRGKSAPHDGLKFPGDWTYAPPEFIYGHVSPDFLPRRMGCDLYMLGNIAAFLFCGINVTADLLAHLPSQYNPNSWNGDYDSVLPYLNHAFTDVQARIATEIDVAVRDDLVRLIRELCNPDLSRRGHPKSVGRHDQYSLERYVSYLDRLSKITEIKVRLQKAM